MWDHSLSRGSAPALGLLCAFALPHALYPLEPLPFLLIYVWTVCDDHAVHLLAVQGMKAPLSYVHALLPCVTLAIGRHRGVKWGFGLHLTARIGLQRLPSVISKSFEVGLAHVTFIIFALLCLRLLSYYLTFPYSFSYLVDLAHKRLLFLYSHDGHLLSFAT